MTALIPLAAAAPLPDAGLARARPRRRQRRGDPLEAAQPDHPPDGRARDRARDPHRAGGAWLAEIDSYVDFLANFGLVFLFFFAGIELVEHRVARRSLVRGTAGWAISIAIGILVGFALHRAGLDAEGWLLGVALSTTALGTLVPILADAGLLPTPLGSAVLGAGVAGEFWPILVVSIFLTGAYGALTETVLLLALRRDRAARGRTARSARARRASSACSSRRCTRPARPPCVCPCSCSRRSSSSRSRWASTSCSARLPAASSSAWR